MQLVPLILTVASSATAATFITLFFARKKTQAEVKSLEIGNVQGVITLWQKLVEGLEVQVKSLTIQVSEFRKENTLLTTEVHQLRKENALFRNDVIQFTETINQLKKDKNANH